MLLVGPGKFQAVGVDRTVATTMTFHTVALRIMVIPEYFTKSPQLVQCVKA